MKYGLGYVCLLSGDFSDPDVCFKIARFNVPGSGNSKPDQIANDNNCEQSDERVHGFSLWVVKCEKGLRRGRIPSRCVFACGYCSGGCYRGCFRWVLQKKVLVFGRNRQARKLAHVPAGSHCKESITNSCGGAIQLL